MYRTAAIFTVIVSGVLLSACNSAPPPLPTPAVLASASTGVPSSTQSTAPTAPPFAVAGADMCTIVTADVIKTTLGLDVDKSQPEHNNVGGTTCRLTKGIETMLEFQLSPDAKTYYLPKIFMGATSAKYDEGTYSGFITPPDSGNANAAIVKGNEFVFVTLYSKTSFTLDQVKALLKVIADAL
jgi:hypothetical protein